MAHVIGGGNRRRQVYHITSNGRLLVGQSDAEFMKPERQSIIYGSPPNVSEIFGREDEMIECQEILKITHLWLLECRESANRHLLSV